MKLNEKEERVLAALQDVRSAFDQSGTDERTADDPGAAVLHLSSLAECFPEAPDRASSWARNSVRKLVEHGLVFRWNGGLYGITQKGREVMIQPDPPSDAPDGERSSAA